MAIAATEKEVEIARQPCSVLELTACRCLAGVSSDPLQLVSEVVGRPLDYKSIFALQWRFHPNKEGLLVPVELDLNAYTLENFGFNPKGYHLAIYCQVSGRRLGVDNRPYAVKSPDGKEVLRVCSEAKEWLLSEHGWTIL